MHLPGVLSPLRDYHAYRQCQTASMARNYAHHGMNFWNPELDTEGPPQRAGTEFPVYSYLLAILFKGLGERDVWGRLLSMFFAAWGALYLYHFVRARLGDTIAFWSAITLCTIPVHVYFTRTVQPEPMALWGLLGFLYYTDKWTSGHRTTGVWMAALLLGATAPLLKLPFLYVLAPLWFMLAFEKEGLSGVFRLKYILLLAGILLATGGWYHYAKSAPIGVLPLTPQDHLENLKAVLSPNLWKAQFLSRFPELVFTYSGLFLAGVGMVNMRRARTYRFLMGWTLISALYVLLLGRYGLIHRYTLLPVAPMAAVWIACGIGRLHAQAEGRPLLSLTLIIFMVGMPLHAGLRIKHWYRVEYDYLAHVREVLDHDGKSSDLLLVVTHEKPQHLYYLNRYGYAIEPESWTRANLIDFQKQGVRYILVPKSDNKTRLSDWPVATKGLATLLDETEETLLYRSVARQG